MLEYPLERLLYRVSIHPLGQQHLVRVRRLDRPGWSAAVESTGARGGRFPKFRSCVRPRAQGEMTSNGTGRHP